ncbi:MAG: trypsin-like serine protease [Chloroflexi bacterium]|nr:trypsin-like serine protease [Chloroflexota bacterium]
MIRTRNKSILILIGLFLLLGLACQAATNPDILDPQTAEVNTSDIVARAVATIEAQSSETELSPSAVNVPALNTQITSDLEQRMIEIYGRVNPSVVHIFVYEGDELAGTGSGFVFDSHGDIVTNNHVVGGGTNYEVVFANGQRRYADVVGKDVDSDLAVIKVDELPADVKPVPLGNSSALRVGQFVIAIGNPFGEQSSMSIGIISGLGRTLDSQRVVAGGYFSIPQVIQTDAAINPGNSGGPLLNLDGEVIGVNSAILSRTGASSGVGFSIPVNAVRNIAPALVDMGEYIYPYLGISMRSEPFNLRELNELGLPPNGVWVSGVGSDTPADKAGLIGHNLSVEFAAEGDYIVAIDGVPVRNSDDLLSYLVFETQVGDPVDLTVIRRGEEVTVPLTLGERP